MYRNRKSETAYNNQRKTSSVACVFCTIVYDKAKVVNETKFFWIYKNLFSYNTWDNLDVKEHLMIIPKEHITKLSELNGSAQRSYMELVTEYDEKGYSHYLRAAGNATKTIDHMHTHLIRLGAKPHNIHFFLRKPYILWFK